MATNHRRLHFHRKATTVEQCHELAGAEFLAASPYCQSRHSRIVDLATSIALPGCSQQERAVALFYWVRDRILYRVGFWHQTALETLDDGRGTCSTKANLLVTLLRAVGIPAGFGVMTVSGKHYLGPIVLPRLRALLSEQSRHFYVFVYLGRRWIRCDASDDRFLSHRIGRINPTARLVEWDGTSDAMLNLDPSHVYSDLGPTPSIDGHLQKPRRPRRSVAGPIDALFEEFADHYLDFLREVPLNSTEPHGVESQLKRWLEGRCLKCLTTFQTYGFLS